MQNNAEEPLESYQKPLTFDQIWLLFQETEKQMKETDRKMQETDRQMKETDKKMQETDRQMKETDRKIKELSNLFTSQWGKLIESLVEGDLVRLLNNRGVEVERVQQRIKGTRAGVSFEFDLIAVNTTEIVIVEVKTTLRPDDVKVFTEKLGKAKVFMPEYKNMKVYGAVAFIKADAGSEKMAEHGGMFVIRATGNSASIINRNDFRPKVY